MKNLITNALLLVAFALVMGGLIWLFAQAFDVQILFTR